MSIRARLIDPFSHHLLDVLNHLPSTRRYWIGYSGGRDSSVLLHALAGLRPHLPGDLEICAVHVDHGLSPHAGAWSQHCATVCAALTIPCQILRVSAKPQSGESPEAAARAARYQAIIALLAPGDVLLTAHHQEDQAETLLLQLLRGAGPHGLAAMPAHTPLGQGWLARPLLDVTAVELANYAEQHKLSWVEDPSNFDTDFDRNYLRHNVIPNLTRQWPAVSRTLSRAAAHAAEAANLLDALADRDMLQVQGPTPDTLSVSGLLTLDEARQRNVLRRWFKRLNLSVPTTVHLQHIQHDILHAAADSVPHVRWGNMGTRHHPRATACSYQGAAVPGNQGAVAPVNQGAGAPCNQGAAAPGYQGAEARRYRDLIYAMLPLPAHDTNATLTWDMLQPLVLHDIGMLTATSTLGEGIKVSLLAATSVTVRFRQGGERCRPAGRGHTHELRKLFQERGIPPWQRDRLPLIYIGDELAAVANLWVCEPFQATHNEPGMVVR